LVRAEQRDPLSNEPRVLVSLHPAEQQMLVNLRQSVRHALTHPQESEKILARLFPITHREDPDEEREHRRLLGESMLESRLEALDRFEATLHRATPKSGQFHVELSMAEVDLWLHVVNDMRLLLATELNIRDNNWLEQGVEDLADLMKFHFLAALSGMQEALLQALR
jgi:hypothetical protein